ncbi:MAG TPA: 16S rRNA (cytosine(1402)-N(4))-methyltransferase RsmH [Gemmatimonadales bacterium]|jgi:16S rRNA (cytosine1402-N4)-methyltransferase|nr:16S rRNA (cytosine(1402)-N(4))-methyltransferase RsmH [Gemmatimonadales bacterium]
MTYHVPVLVGPLMAAIGRPVRAVDGTLGDGGHAAALLDAGAEVLGIDRDPDAIATAERRLGHERIQYLEAPYASAEALDAVSRFAPDVVLLDLGVSSRQLDEDARGFSFRPGAPLDMRMSAAGPSAADWLNRTDEAALAAAFREYGDERGARRLAREIVRRRPRASFSSSDDLVNAIRAALGPRAGPADFARLFQAVRIAVNDELAGLASALPALRDALVSGGRLAVISYHSGEDRVVKHAFQDWSRRCICPPGHPVCTCRSRALGRAEPRKPILPDADEIQANPRARSAKLRIFRVDHAV